MPDAKIRAVTVDFWGTLMFDPPASDNRYKQKRLADFETILRAAGLAVTPKALDRAYEESGRRLAKIWQTHRDVPVQEHVTTLLDALEPGLPGRLGSGAMAALVQAYANPALLVPPTPDLSAKGALTTLAAQGTILCVVSNTMRTPGVVLRKILERYGLLAPFKLLTFSDECGVRKPDPEIFHLTLRQLGLAPHEAVHVGDDPVLDVQGAQQAGMRVIQVTAMPPAALPRKPDAVVRQLGELPAALSQLT
ncbi:MAG: HAD family hydrolase [Candidatus Rokubacteria bacterium]|nr:HAD family hydrolase [Candidatus Rokubacteria bacterium]